jgi:hypothetical protein
MAGNKEYWFNAADHEYLDGIYRGIVRESFRRENIAAARRSWNRKSLVLAAVTAAGFVLLIVLRK